MELPMCLTTISPMWGMGELNQICNVWYTHHQNNWEDPEQPLFQILQNVSLCLLVLKSRPVTAKIVVVKRGKMIERLVPGWFRLPLSEKSLTFCAMEESLWLLQLQPRHWSVHLHPGWNLLLLHQSAVSERGVGWCLHHSQWHHNTLQEWGGHEWQWRWRCCALWLQCCGSVGNR